MSEYLLIDAAFGRPVPRFPVWFMRQAGRYLPQYRAVRDQSHGFLHMCRTPDIAAEISIQPYRILGVDAVIMFSDILTPLIGMGIDLVFNPGPHILNPIRSESDIQRLNQPDPADNTGYVGELLAVLRRELAERVPVIGFAGAPFTLASYLTADDGFSKTSGIKKLMYSRPQAYAILMDKLTALTVNYLNYQIESGAEVVQLFDTWAGELDSAAYREYVLPYVRRVFAGLKQKNSVPQIYFVNGSAGLLNEMTLSGADIISVDWRTDLTWAFSKASSVKMGVQGNLEPFLFFADRPHLTDAVNHILDTAKNSSRRFIFNLGHGIHKDTDPDNVAQVIRMVQEFRL